jgi:hypothetical protein
MGSSVPQPGDDDFDPTAPQPGQDGYEEWLARQAQPPPRPSEHLAGPEDLRPRAWEPGWDKPGEESTRSPAGPSFEEKVDPIVHGYLLSPRIAMALLGYLGQQPYDEVAPLIDALNACPTFSSEGAETFEQPPVDGPGQGG